MVGNTSSRKGNNRGLIFVLIGLIVIAVILGVIIAIVVNNKPSTPDINEEIEAGVAANQEYVKELIAGDKSYQISERISKEYSNGNKEEALKMFVEELDKALSEQDYELYIELFEARSTMLNFDNRCQEALAFYDSVDYGALSADNRLTMLYGALDESIYCGDSEREAFWNGQIDLIPQKEVDDEDL